MDIPYIKPHVTEHRMHAVKCKGCGKVNRAEKPSDVPESVFGPRVTSLVALLSGEYRLSKRSTEAFVSTVCNLPMSLGSVMRCEQRVSDRLEPVYDEVHASLRTQRCLHADETGWHQRDAHGHDSRPYLWTAGDETRSVFAIQQGRSQDQASALLGDEAELKAFLVVDRYGGYNHYPLHQRQFCWAHLKRDFTAISERDEGGSALIGQKLLEQTHLVFTHYHAYDRDHNIDFLEFQRRMRPVQAEVLRWLRMGKRSGCTKTAGTCKLLLKQRAALWTFVRIAFVPPTNNQGERDLRHAVLLRRTSHGTHSENGSRFVERILTVVTTLRKQRRKVWTFLTELMTAKTGSLLPDSTLENPRASPLQLAA